jgi:hypothetical protein
MLKIVQLEENPKEKNKIRKKRGGGHNIIPVRLFMPYLRFVTGPNFSKYFTS